MSKYTLRYWFEHGGTCLWAINNYAKEKFGYAISNEELPISQTLVEALYLLEQEYFGYLDWDYPPNPSPWTPKQKKDFKNRANETYFKLLLELGDDFEVINDIDECVI